MNNIANTQEYIDRRKRTEDSFDKYISINSIVEYESLSGNYKLIISSYKIQEGCWSYTKGEVRNKDGEVIFTVFRNYSDFLYRWIEHNNGNEYLLCGEDYQGYVILNLTQKKKHVYFPESGIKGYGFCWVNIKEYDKDCEDYLLVEGCYWGAPYEIVKYDFTNPDKVPLKELDRWDDYPVDEDEESEEVK